MLGEKLGAALFTDWARLTAPAEERVAALELRDSVWLRERNLRRDAERLGGAEKKPAEGWAEAKGEMGGLLGPRRAYSRWMAASQSVSGSLVDGPMGPQPECCVKLA